MFPGSEVSPKIHQLVHSSKFGMNRLTAVDILVDIHGLDTFIGLSNGLCL